MVGKRISKARTLPSRATQEVGGGQKVSLVLCATSRHPEVTPCVKASQCLATRSPGQSQLAKMPMSFASILFSIKKSPLLSTSPRRRELLLPRWEAPQPDPRAGHRSVGKFPQPCRHFSQALGLTSRSALGSAEMSSSGVAGPTHLLGSPGHQHAAGAVGTDTQPPW